MVSVSPPWTTRVSATYCVTRYRGSLRSESITASDGGKLRVGPVGKPSRRAVAVSRRPWAAESAAVRGGVVSGRAGGGGDGVAAGGGGGGDRLGTWASSAPAATSNRAASPAALAAPARARRARRLSTTHAHQIPTS